jgi:hypothetical protein
MQGDRQPSRRLEGVEPRPAEARDLLAVVRRAVERQQLSSGHQVLADVRVLAVYAREPGDEQVDGVRPALEPRQARADGRFIGREAMNVNLSHLDRRR